MRKGHGSSKVPNVKLRPAPSGKSKSAVHTAQIPSWTQDAVDEDFSDLKKGCTKPFVGIVVSASGVRDKPGLFAQAEDLGAQTSSNLTDRVTHLIADGPGSAKYAYCVEHRMPVMKSDWIWESHALWLNGDNVDVQTTLSTYRLPTFTTVRLCLTGIEPVEKRAQVHKLLSRHGGTFAKDLNTTVTHVLCGEERGAEVDERGWTAKMQYAEKANKKGAAKIHLVWEEWFWDCLESGGLLNESDYVVTKPRPERRVLDEAAPFPPASSSVSGTTPSPRKLPPSLSSSSLLNATDAEEIVAVKRVPEITARLWEGLLKKRGFEVKSGKLMRCHSQSQGSGEEGLGITVSHPTNLSSTKPITATTPDISPGIQIENSIAAFRRSKSFASNEASTSTSTSRPLQRLLGASASEVNTASSCDVTPSTLGSSAACSFTVPHHAVENTSALFLGLKFCLLGEARSPTLKDAVQSRGGIIVSKADHDLDFIVVRLSSGGIFYRDEPDESFRKRFRTECWVERCLFEERICEPEEHVAFKPLDIKTPILGAEKLSIHCSGLDLWEKCWSTRLSRALGANTPDKFTRRNTHLLCPSGTGAKFDKALEWGIQVVTLEWLVHIARTGEINPSCDYSVLAGGVSSLSSNEGCSETQDVMTTITNITNIGVSQGSSYETLSSTHLSAHPTSETCSHPAVHSPTDEVIDIRPHGLFGPLRENLLISKTAETKSAAEPSSSSSVSLFPPSSASSPLKASSLSDARPICYPRQPSSDHLDREMQTLRIPSSKSPSPMKIPPVHQVASSSPLIGESANALKNTIASLLGKRQTSDDSAIPSQTARGSKRPRPPPRLRSRQELNSSATSVCSDSGAYPRPPSPNDLQYGGSGMKVEDVDDGHVDESMRITYEDPGQRDEKRRLMSLLSNEEPSMLLDSPSPPNKSGNGRRGKNAVRKSTRMAGF